MLCFSFSTTQASEPITPIPENLVTDPDKVRLGKQLFFDTTLSRDDTVSCATCHALTPTAYGAEKKSVSTGIEGKQGIRNAPTVINAAFDFKQFWDGRAATLAEQAAGPVTNPLEMGMHNWEDVVAKIKKDRDYQHDFQQIYENQITAANIQDAIAEFEKTLISPDSPFDQFLKGDENAITERQKKGYKYFKQYGCTGCHQGVNVGGNMFQKIGALKNIQLHNGSFKEDLGRYGITKNEWDKHVFKVPSLRLAVKTSPYFHDGSVEAIEEAIDIMISYQLDRRIPEENRGAIIDFLHSLTGPLPLVKQ